jgi:acyl transferase domain-containing protein/NADPH:quinone reductase-like Zn-dependent oxidoreductase/acyl carrier protein
MGVVESHAQEPIAIVGMGCRLPGASDYESLWKMVLDRREGVTEYPGGRTPELDAFYRRLGLSAGPVSNRGGFLPEIDKFDAPFFELSPREAEWLDPQQRLLLEVTWETLEDAGIPLNVLARKKTGVFVGVWSNEYERHAAATAPVAEFFLVTGGPLYGTSSRLAFQFDLRGPDISVNAACGSSLVAVHLATRSLRSGECSVALAGGVNVIVRREITQAFSRSQMLSRDGRCKFGDAGADGFVRSDGAGMLVLKRLSDAQRDDDRVLAVIRGTAMGNDGRGSGLLATPSAAGQRQAMLDALADAGLDPMTVDLVEAHGTGTRAGDPIEISAIASVFGRSGSAMQPCRIASVKSNIGHTESAAGVASIIRTVQALRHRRFPATLHVNEPNPAIDWETVGVALELVGSAWQKQKGTPRRASVNGLGLTGTNAHVVLEEFPQAQGARTEPRNAYLLPLSASSSAALRQHAKDVAASLDALQDQEEATGALTDFCYTASLRRNHLGHRVAVAGADAPELAERLKDFARGTESAFTAAGTVTRERRPKIAFVFPGQGSQWVGMGRELLRTQSVFRSAIEEIDQAIALETGWSVLRQLEEPSSEQRLARIDVVQPTLFAMEVALARLWTSMGVVPEAVVGHSMGEVAAAHIAGILSLQDAAAIICRRSALLMRVAGAGAMAVVDLARAEAQQLLAGLEDKVSVAVCNSPRSTVLAGDPATLNEIVEGLEKQDIFCRWVRVDVASHSPQMDLLIGDLSAALADVQARAGSIPMCSTVRLAVSNGSEMSGSYWVANLRQPVLFANAIEELMRQGFDTFLEMSPHPTLVPFVEQTAAQAGRQALAVGPLRRDEPETATLLAALGQLYAAGGEVDWQRIYPSGNLVKLPAYPWQRERFWIESSGTQRFGILAETGHPLIGEAIQTAQGEWIWTARLSAEVHHWLKDHAVQGTVLLPASAYIELAGTAATMIFGGEPARVEKLRLLRAAALPPGSSCELQIVATSDSRDRYSAKFFWRESGAEWTEAAECVLLRAAQERLNQADLTLWEDLEFSQETMSGGQHAATMRGLGYDFGPSFCRIAWMAIQNESWFARIDLPGELRGERYLLHPAALDAALQLLGRILIERGERKTLLPVAIEKVEWEGLSVDGSALYARGTVHSGTLAGDVDLFDAAGRPVVAIRGLAFSPMDRASEAISELLYEIKWERLDTADNHVKTAGHWVLIADGSGMAGELGRALEIRGASIEVVQPAEILHGDIARDDAVQGVVWLTPLGFDSHSTLAEIQQLLADGAALVSKLTDSPDAFALTQICMVTRGTQTMTGEPVTNVLGAGTWGLFGSVANEYSSLRTLCADLPSVPVENEVVRLADLLLEDRKEGQIALRAKGNFGARLRSFETDAGNFQNIPAGQLRSTEQGESEGFELAQAITGSLDSFELVAAWSKPPKDEEVEIAVQAAGINFRDVLVAMGVHEALKGSRIGGECSGTVLRVGEKVVGFRPGDAVIALSPSLQKTGMFATRVTVPESLVVKKPENISFAQAAGIPCVFLTAWYALVKLARLQKGERILIHAAAGGVGLAAIQIANWIGAEIYATVGSEEKRRHLRSLGVKQIMHSRKLDFTREVLEQTNGEGVDVVLNSLAGPAIAAGLEALAPYGRFIEIGKLDLWENSKIGLQPFLRNLSLFAVDLAQSVEDRREMVGAMFTEVMNLLNDGSIAPVPTTVFPVSSAADAFQLMASGGHIGKIVLNMQDESAMIRRDKSRLAKEATYLITGGLGGLGLLTAQALAQHGARHLVLTWRHTASDEALQVIAGLKESGVTIETRQADMSADADVEALLEEIAATMPPLRGVVHAAGILDDAVVSHLSLSKFESVMAGKVGGALALDARLKDFDLDFLVYYSSVAGVLGSPGQANYAAANAMLDALAYNQRARGIPAISIDWGSWSTVGLAAAKDIRGARIASRGLKPLSPEEGVELLIEILRREPTQVTAMHLDREQWCASNPAAARSGLLANLMEKSATSARDGGDFLARLRLLDGEELRPTLTAWLREQVAAVLRLSVERVPEDKALRSLGLDSLMALELRNRMERHLRLTLSATLVWNYPTISALAAHLENRLSPTHPVETGAKADSSIGVETKSFVAEQTDSDRQSVAEMLEAELMEVESLHASSEGWR